MADLVLGVAKSLVEGTLTKAQSAIEEESKLRQSAQRDLVFIAGEFQMMQSFLSVTTEEHVRNKIVSTWVTQVRDLAYDVEDCVEFIIHLDTRSDWWLRLIKCCNCMAPALPLDEAITDIEQLKARVQDVSQRNIRYNLISDVGPKPIMEMQQPATSGASSGMRSKTRDTDWMQQDLEELIKLITRKGSGLEVISVWATWGDFVSTSITRKAFDDPNVWENFTCRAWVKLSHPFNLHNLIRSLLDQFYANFCEVQQEAIIETGLVQEFMQQVNNQTYLVVLEDVSTLVEWEAIRKYLPDRRNGSRIIVSTQQFEIASFCTGLPYYQRFSADQSVCIFFKEGPQADEGKNKTTDRETTMTPSSLMGRMPEINELPNYPAKARVNALQVMSVWGVAGAGKSALVRNMYHKKVLTQNNEFDKHGWVDVSYPFKMWDFCHSLLLQLHSHSLEANEAIYCGTRGIRDPIKECHKLLKDHRCLVVIDNLKSKEEWDLIQAVLVSRPSESIIIVITNEASLALHCADRKELVFNVKGLEIGAAIDLFRKEVRKNAYFPADDIDNDEELRQLISKCGGLPKVIVAIADSLAQVFEWTERTRILNDQFITNLETRQEFACLQGLFGWIHCYFRSCPDFLKPCIFYLSIFPKSQVIRRRRLVMRWVAEGYSKDNASHTAEENGEELFSKIIELSMIQPPEQAIITNMRMIWFQVSAFFHEYIISRPKEENVTFALEIFALQGCICQSTGRTGRHLVIDKSWERDKIVFESIDFSRLRSFTVFGKWESFFISPSMKILRVLDLENASGVTNEDLKKMVNLLPRLKYLSLRGCSEICHLPSSLGDLRQLQILDVRNTSIVTFPASFTKLKKLQYIRGGTTSPADLTSRHELVAVELHAGIEKLTALHTIGVVNVENARGKAILNELGKLTQLRKLGVFGVNIKNSNEFRSAISGHAHLESLSVWINKNSQNCLDGISSGTPPPKNLQSLKLFGLVNKLPVWINLLGKIKKLVLEITTPAEHEIAVLGGLQELCVLRICIKSIQDCNLHFLVKTEEGVEVLSYEKVKVLEIACSSPLLVTFGSLAMRSLEQLMVHCCRGLTLPFDEIRNLTKLREVQIMGSQNNALKEKLKEKLKDHPNKPAFWNAPKPRRSSFTWRSLMHGKKLLERGVLWRVGDGKTIRISRDRWVQSSSLLKPIASLPDDLTVNFLINEETKSWNEQRVRSCFTPDDTTEILNIPLSLTYCEDFPSWPHSKSGIYTVKTAYSLVRLESMHHFLSSNGRGESSDQTEVSKLWKRLWSIQAPPKMKTVLWRMVQNCLPTGAQLRQRHIPASDTCYFCGREETVEHIFLRCQFASGIWREMKKAFGLRCKFNYMAPIKQWFFDFLADASDEETMVFTITVWHIWQTRNAVRNGEKAEHPSSVVQRAKAYVEMILLHLFKLRTSHRCESKCSPPRWIPPPDGWLMLNVDAAIFKDPPRSGVGLVIRDHLGQFRAACCLLVQKIGDPELAEAIAVRCAISFAKENNLQQVIVASDCQNIISKIHSSTKDRSYVGIIVQDIKNLSRGSLFSFTHVSRRGNEAAHVIARLADQFAGSVWYIEPPEIIRNVICNDLSN